MFEHWKDKKVQTVNKYSWTVDSSLKQFGLKRFGELKDELSVLIGPECGRIFMIVKRNSLFSTTDFLMDVDL